MTKWQATFLGLKHLPRELSGFEIEAFFTFTLAERQLIEERRRPALKLGLALQIGFLRMSGRVLDSVRIVPPALWRHLGSQFGVQAPDLASLRAMYRRHRTLYEHQELACAALGFHPLIEARRRAWFTPCDEELTVTLDRSDCWHIASTMVVRPPVVGDAREGSASDHFRRHSSVRSEVGTDDSSRCGYCVVGALAGYLGAGAGVIADDTELAVGAAGQAFDTAN